MTAIAITAKVGGVHIAADSFDITGSSYGSVGHATIGTSQAWLEANGIDLYGLATGSAGIVEVEVVVAVDGRTTRIFGGEYLTTTWELDQGTVEIHARSWAGILVDQKRILTKIGNAVISVLAPLAPGQISAAGISNQNQTISNIVTSIAQEFGFTPVINIQSGNNPTIGTLYGSADQAFLPVPQSLWAILNQLARDTGYVVFDTPNRELVFGTPGVGSTPITIGYETVPPGVLPFRDGRVDHNPRRNSTFRVMVISYDPSQRSVSVGRAVYVGRGFANSKGLASGLSVGPAAQSLEAKLAALDQSRGTVALYIFHSDGLTQAQAQQSAGAIATDISKRELILSAVLDGMPTMRPTQIVHVTGNVPTAFSASPFFISGYTHSFRMPAGGESPGDGFWTAFKGLNIPTEALASDVAG